MASVHICHIVSYIVHLSEVARCGRFTLASYAFFIAHEAVGAQEDAWSKPRRRHAPPLKPDLSLATQNIMSLRPYHRLSPSVAAQRCRCWHCLLSAGTQPATMPKAHSLVCTQCFVRWLIQTDVDLNELLSYLSVLLLCRIGAQWLLANGYN